MSTLPVRQRLLNLERGAIYENQVPGQFCEFSGLALECINLLEAVRDCDVWEEGRGSYEAHAVWLRLVRLLDGGPPLEGAK